MRLHAMSVVRNGGGGILPGGGVGGGRGGAAGGVNVVPFNIGGGNGAVGGVSMVPYNAGGGNEPVRQFGAVSQQHRNNAPNLQQQYNPATLVGDEFVRGYFGAPPGQPTALVPHANNRYSGQNLETGSYPSLAQQHVVLLTK